MKRYVTAGMVCLMLIVATVNLNAQTSFGDNTMLYIGHVDDETDERYTRSVYLKDIETDTDALAIGHVNDFGSEVGWSSAGGYVHIINYDDEGNRLLTIYDVEADTYRTLTNTLHDNECLAPAYWSPDDRFLAYVDLDNEQAVMKLWDTRDDSVITVREVDRDFSFYRELWSPDGRYLTIPTVDYEATVLWDTVSQSEITTLEISGKYPPVSEWSSDDRYLMFNDYDVRGGGLSIFDTVTATAEIITTNTRRLGRVSSDNHLVIVPYTEPDVDGNLLYLHDLESDNKIKIGERSSSMWNVHWSAHNDYISYTAIDERDTYSTSLKVYTVATGEPRTILSEIPNIRSTRWSPTAVMFAVTYDFTNEYHEPAHVALYDVDTDTLTEFDSMVVTSYYNGSLFTWTPDGRYLAMVTPEYGLRLYDVSSGDFIDMSDWAGQPTFRIFEPWSWDGRYMLFSGLGHGDMRNLYVYDFETHEALPVLDADDFGEFIGLRGANENASLIFCGTG